MYSVVQFVRSCVTSSLGPLMAGFARRNVLGPKGHAVALFRERVMQLRVEASGEPIDEAKQLEVSNFNTPQPPAVLQGGWCQFRLRAATDVQDVEASCKERKAGECSSNKEQHPATTAELVEPVEKASVRFCVLICVQAMNRSICLALPCVSDTRPQDHNHRRMIVATGLCRLNLFQTA